MSFFNKRTSVLSLDPNIIIWNLGKQYKSQFDSDDNNTDIIKIFTSEFSSHHSEIPVSMIIKDYSHQQSLLNFSHEQLKANLIQLKLNTVINQINNHFVTDFYEMMTAWQ